MLEVVIALKLLTEIAGLALIGQGIVYALAAGRVEGNIPYQVLKTITSPVFALARLVTPRFVEDRFLWLVTPPLVFLLWVLFTYLKIRLALGI